MPVQRILMVGHAQLPNGMAAKGVYDTLAVTAEIEPTYAVIVRASATLVTEEGREFFSNLLVGRNLNDSVEDVLQEIRHLYQGAAQNALVAATKDLWRKNIALKSSGHTD